MSGTMKLKFKVQPYQTDAVNSVVDCFAGQPMVSGIAYRIDPGRKAQISVFGEGFRNADIALTEEQVLVNMHDVQNRQKLPPSESLDGFTVINARGGEQTPAPTAYTRCALTASRYHLDIEMETGTGKTYCYIKTIFEMNKRHGWSKFIIMVPSVAIREGVYKSLQITAEHFTESYGKKARFFIYNSKRLHELESFSSDAGINVMVINIQAFASQSAENRKIYDELDDFQSRCPIDVIASNRPILILDEPQKMQGDATMKALPKFKPLMILRYSATHKTQHNLIYRLDALDAFNQKLVKKIAVRGIQVRGATGMNAYLYLEGIDISTKTPVARIELEVKQKSGKIKRQLRRLKSHDNLFTISNKLDQYQGFVIAQIDHNHNTVEFANGEILKAGEITRDVTEYEIRRIQIRETIRAHFDTEKKLFAKGIKVLSLFFIDEVSKYRDYEQANEKGEYARIFEEEYKLLKDSYLSNMKTDNEVYDKAYQKYLVAIDEAKTHNGYFSIDKKTNRLKDPKVGIRVADSNDVDAYDLILKDKESLLTLPGPSDSADQRAKRNIRFIFSHSALREGWDNPNVFVMCMLKHSDNTISRRQEVGRGLRLSVDQHGDRTDHQATVHDINILTIVANESYQDFVRELQKEILETLSPRPRRASEAYFMGKTININSGNLTISPAIARAIHRYLIKNLYITDDDRITSTYHDAKDSGALAALPNEINSYADQIFLLIDGVFSDAQLPKVDDGWKLKSNPLNANFCKKEFQELWSRINRKAVYRVKFDSNELIRKCVHALDSQLRVTPLQYTIQAGQQGDATTEDQLKAGNDFKVTSTNSSIPHSSSVHSWVKYDLIGTIAENTQLTRCSTASILSGVQASVFARFQQNPEDFIEEVSRIISDQKATIIIERLDYDVIDDRYDVDIFTANQIGQDFSCASDKLKNHIYDYVVTDSDVERRFATDLDTSAEVAVYAKLPRGFLISTPVGDYNPDWAISFKEGNVKHIYFVAETKGSLSSMEFRQTEQMKIDSAKQFFESLKKSTETNPVRYSVVTSYNDLMDLIQ